MRARTRTARQAVVLAAVASLGAGLLAGCADDSGDDNASDGASSGGGKGKTTITLGLFGTFGYKEAVHLPDTSHTNRSASPVQ